MTRRLLYLLPVLLFALVAAYLLLQLRSGRDPSVLASVLIDKPAPAFAAEPLQADLPGVARADLGGGEVVLVNFFASWCAPCRIEHPLLMRLAKEEGLALYGIAYKDKPEDARKLLAELGNPFQRVGLDLTGRTGIEFGITGVPESFLIGPDGRVRFRQPGPLDPYTLEHILLPRVKELRR